MRSSKLAAFFEFVELEAPFAASNRTPLPGACEASDTKAPEGASAAASASSSSAAAAGSSGGVGAGAAGTPETRRRGAPAPWSG